MEADWAMVIITAIYVVATIGISVFNYRSTKAAINQNEISKYHFEERKRIDNMPFLQMEKMIYLSEEKRMRYELDLSISDCENEDINEIVKIINLGHSAWSYVKI